MWQEPAHCAELLTQEKEGLPSAAWALGSPTRVHEVNTIIDQAFQVKIKEVVRPEHMETFLWAPVNVLAMPYHLRMPHTLPCF